MLRNSAYGSNYPDQTHKRKHKWYQLSVEHVLIVPVQADIARRRVEEAFAAPTTIYKHYFNFKFRYVEYTGTLTGNHMDAFFNIFNRRYTYTYHVQGEILEDLRGSRIEITLPAEKTLPYFLRFLAALFIVFLFNPSVAGLIILLLFFISVGFILHKILYESAARRIARILDGIIADPVPAINVPAMVSTPAQGNPASAVLNLKTFLKEPGMFHRPFSYKGRIRRTEYIISFIFHAVAANLVLGVGSYFDHERKVTVASLIILGILFLLILSYSIQIIKRCHDCEKSGWWILVPFYPLILVLEEGVRGPNKYGPDAKKEET